MSALSSLRELAADQQFRRRAAAQAIDDHKGRISGINARVQKLHEARELLIEGARVSRAKTIGFVEKIVTHALRSVFEDTSLAFVIATEERRGALEADYLVEWVKDGVRLRNHPMKAQGGSLWSVISVALRLIFLTRYKPARRRLLILDEPEQHIDAIRLERFTHWLYTLAREFNIQIILVTHSPKFLVGCDKVYQLKAGAHGVVVTHRAGEPSVTGYGSAPQE